MRQSNPFIDRAGFTAGTFDQRVSSAFEDHLSCVRVLARGFRMRPQVVTQGDVIGPMISAPPD